MAIKRYCLAFVLLVNSVYAFGAEFLYCPITLSYKMDYRSGSGNWSTVNGTDKSDESACSADSVNMLETKTAIDTSRLSPSGTPGNTYWRDLNGDLPSSIQLNEAHETIMSSSFRWLLNGNENDRILGGTLEWNEGNVVPADVRTLGGGGHAGWAFVAKYESTVRQRLYSLDVDLGDQFISNLSGEYVAEYRKGLYEIFRPRMQVIWQRVKAIPRIRLSEPVLSCSGVTRCETRNIAIVSVDRGNELLPATLQATTTGPVSVTAESVPNITTGGDVLSGIDLHIHNMESGIPIKYVISKEHYPIGESQINVNFTLTLL
ncbi:hypothetical protein YT21_23455 [Salmonella enterica subsp. enterica serovar Newport]|nr:hypothetical protein [Salmonella enterica subsp. enterica serovar Newport]